MADLTFRFGSTGADSLARDMGKVADTSVLAARGARLCADALEKQRRATDVSAGAALALAKADDILKEAEHGLRDGALEAELALKRQAAAERQAGRDAEQAAAKVSLLDRALDGLGKKTGPSFKGIMVGLSPALIPAAAGIAGAIGAIGVSFGAALTGAGLFGAMAKSVLGQAGKDSQKLSALQASSSKATAGLQSRQAIQVADLQRRIAQATTASQKQALQKQLANLLAHQAEQRAALTKTQDQQIATLRAGWSKSYSQVIDTLDGIKGQWKGVSEQIASPVLVPWLDAVYRGLRYLKPLVQPVADLFRSWGQSIDAYFKSKTGSEEIGRIASALGRFSADQLSAIGVFLTDFVKGVANLGHLLGLHGTDFGAFSVYLDQWGGAFARWSASKSARHDVTVFLDYVHANGKTLGDLLKNLGMVMGALAPGLSGAGALELKVLTDFFGFIAVLPKGVQNTLGALLLLSKTGVLKVGFKFVGPVLSWLTGGLISIGGAAKAAGTLAGGIVSGAEAAAPILSAAVSGGGTAAAAEMGAAGGVAGKGAAGGFVAALGAAPLLPLLAGILGGAAVKGFGDSLAPKGSVAGAASQGFQQTGAPGATITGGFVGWAAQALGIGAAAKKATASLLPLQSVLENVTTAFTNQKNSAQYAMISLDNYTTAVKDNGVGSTQAQGARQQLVTDLEHSGLNAAQANGDVGLYTKAILDNGVNSDAARAARRRLIGDIFSARGNAQQGNTDLATYTAAVKNHSLTSDAVRAARQHLITDLQNTGLDAKTSAGLVDGLGTSVKNLPKSKTVTVGVNATATGTISIVGSGWAAGQGNIRFHAGGMRAGGLVQMGAGPVADDVPAMLSKGEVVVPARMVSAGAVDHLRGRLPGFANGGFVGVESSIGSMLPITSQVTGDDAKKAVTTGINEALAAAKKLLGGSGLAVLNYAMQYLHKVPYVWGGSSPSGWDCCLTATSQVLTVTGPKAIIDITAGDTVWTWDEGRPAACRVVRRSAPRWQMTYRVVTASAKLEASGNHPFLTAGGQWTEVDDLRPGDLVTRFEDGEFRCEPVEAVEPLGEADTYDITVEGTHNFIAEGLVVHNSGYVSWVLDHMGMFRGRTTAAGFQAWANPSAPVPGGLAFYGRPAHHVGFVTADGRLLSALGRAWGTTITGLQMGDNSGYGIPPQGFGVPGGGAGAGPTGSKLRELAYSMLVQRGWGVQWPAFNSLETQEAGWNMFATNPSSKAYGLAQMDVPPGGNLAANKAKYFAYGGDWRTAQGQLTAMMNYIAQVYGDPNAAWAHEIAKNWYALGGLVRRLAAGGAIGPPGSTFVTDTLPDLAGLKAAVTTEEHAFWALAGRKLPVKGTKGHPAPTKAQRAALAAWDRVLARQQVHTVGIGKGGLFQRLLDAHARNKAASPAAFTSALSYLTREVAGTGIRGGINPPGTPRNSGYVPWHYFHPQWQSLLNSLRGIVPHLKLPPITHTYGGDVANRVAPVLSSALAPFTGGVSMDQGGWLQPGWNPPMYNGLGRPEPVGAAAGGGLVTVQLDVTGADQEFATLLRKMVRVKGGGSVQAAFGAR